MYKNTIQEKEEQTLDDCKERDSLASSVQQLKQQLDVTSQNNKDASERIDRLRQENDALRSEQQKVEQKVSYMHLSL